MQPEMPHNLPLIIGHRGASRDAPENTLESFRLALEQGADGIEADFRLTADCRIICMHDDSTARTTGTMLKIADTPLKELRRLDAGLWKGEIWRGAVIPTLDEVLALIPWDRWLFIEIKCGTEIIPHLEPLLRASSRAPDRVRLLSFSAALVAELKRCLPEWPACWTFDYRRSRSQNLQSSRADVFDTLVRSGAAGLTSSNSAFLDRGFVESLKGIGMEIHVWTVDRLPDAKLLREMGVDSIMTNRPGRLRWKPVPGESPR